MKRLVTLVAVIFALLFAVDASHAQQPTRVQQDPTLLDAATLVTTASGTAQQTVTITPPSGQYVYLVSVEIISTATTAPAASALTHTTTNLGGMKWFGALTATAGVADKVTFYPGRPVKSAASGTAVTIVSNAAITNVTYNVTATYYFAP